MGNPNSIQVAVIKRQRREHYAHVFFWDRVIFYLYILTTNSNRAKEKSMMKLLFIFHWQIISDKKTSAQKIPNQLFPNLFFSNITAFKSVFCSLFLNRFLFP